MATYIQGLYNKPLDFTPFTPDYGFLNTVLKTKEAQYEQGFAQVKSMYNSLIQKKLTNQEDKDAQKKYIADAELKLKNLATVDLSVDKNVGLASEVFKPFFEDDELVYDAYLTANSEKQLSVGQGFLSSDDPKKRALHSSISDQYVGISLDELKRAKRGDGSIFSVKPRNYIPAPNLTERFKDLLDPTKYKSVIQTPNGAGLIIQTAGGETVEKGLYNIINGMITGDDRLWFNAWGEVTHNNAVNEYINQGYKEDEARRNVATDFYERDLKFYQDRLAANQTNLKEINETISKLKTLSDKNGGFNEAESKKYQSLLNTRSEYEKAVKDYDEDVKDLTAADKKEAAINRYYTGKGGVLGKMFLENAIQSITKGMGILTKDYKVVLDEPYFKTLEHMRGMEDLRIKEMKALNGEEGDGGSGGTKSGSKASSGIKLSEEEKQRLIADTPVEGGLPSVPQEEKPDIYKFYQLQKNLYSTMLHNGINAIETMYGKDREFEASGVGLYGITKQLREAHLSGDFFKPVKEFNLTQGKSPVTPEEKAFSKFKELFYTKAQDSNSPSEFESYLKEKGKSGEPTYGDVYDFMLQKSFVKYSKSKDTLPDEEFITLAGDFFKNIEEAKVIEKIFDQTEKDITSNVLSKLNTFVSSDKYDYDTLVITDSSGKKRLRTEQELQELKKDYYTVVGKGRISISASGNVPIISKFPPTKLDMIDKSEKGRAEKIQNTFRDFSQLEKQINERALTDLRALNLTLDEKNLKAYGTYILQDYKDVKGEIAEQAVIKLFSPENISISNEDPLKSAVNVVSILGDKASDKNKIQYLRELMNELSTQVKVTGNNWANSVEYRQVSTTRGDNRREYVIRLDNTLLDNLIKDYKTVPANSTATEKTNIEKANILLKIKEVGLEVRTNTPIPGDISSYGLVERFHQANGFYESPESLAHIYKFRINKSSDGSRYELSDNSYYNYTDPDSGTRIKVPITGLVFPGNSSFTKNADIIKNFIVKQVSELAALRKAKAKTQKKTTAAEIEKQFEQQQ